MCLKFHKVLIIITIACILCLIVQGSRCVVRYLRKDSRVIQNLMSAREVTFVAFTVCPSFADAYNETMLNKIGTNKEKYKAGKIWDFACFYVFEA